MPRWAYVGIPVLLQPIVLGGTRSIWLAMVPAVLYLTWFWRPKMVLAVPVIIVAAYFASPRATPGTLSICYFARTGKRIRTNIG